uniref:Uncharacterized protein n=1 Tax=Anopheles coluzzii TaxID=1518534 RepID=A0A8W7PRW0_ANOCL
MRRKEELIILDGRTKVILAQVQVDVALNLGLSLRRQRGRAGQDPGTFGTQRRAHSEAAPHDGVAVVVRTQHPVTFSLASSGDSSGKATTARPTSDWRTWPGGTSIELNTRTLPSSFSEYSAVTHSPPRWNTCS